MVTILSNSTFTHSAWWDDDHDRETNLYGINFYKPHFGDTYGMINDDLDEKFVRQQGDPNGK